ncbi:hypothetical protein BGZ80_006990, partial [Entomortierella chlamydospora]
DLILWRVAIAVDEGAEDEIILAANITSKEPLETTTTLTKAFKDVPTEDTIHIIVERLQAPITQNFESEARIAKLEEIEDLRGNREDGDAVLTIVHSRETPQHETGGIERLSNDAQFRKIIQQYRKTNTKTIAVALETPTKKYTNFTLTGVNNLYGISNLKVPEISDLPPFEGISSGTLDSDLHKESLKRLIDELDSRIRSIPAYTLNDAPCSAYVCSFFTQVVLIFNDELTIAPERLLRGRHGHGKVDYSIESLANDGTRHILCVTEVKQEDFRRGVAQNLVQLESSLAARKRKRCDEDGGDRELEDDKSVPLKAYGIVTDAAQ